MVQNSNNDVSLSLFERLGGVKGITLIVDDAIEAHMNNPVIQDRFTPYKAQPERLMAIRNHSIDFFSAGSGGNVEYKGRDMTKTHEGMGINAEEYICAIDDILVVLDNHNIDETSKKDVLAILWSLKGLIIGK